MSYLVFARKYRPKTFDEVIGQGHITTTLVNAIRLDRVAHAYLFSGPRGIGKTTTARIFAKALNCERGPAAEPCSKCISCREISDGISMDVIEIDGASNRGIDEVRQLRENVKFSPARGRYKLYIIDEVHMLTQEAFNALLKTLEEPPPHVKFIFATTQAHKVIATVSSRCQRFDFRRIPAGGIAAQLRKIAKAESIKIDDESLTFIARQADGSLRDAESILDQLNTFTSGAVKREDIAHILGAVDDDLLAGLTDIILKRDAAAALEFTDRAVNEGKDLSSFLLGLMGHFRNLAVAKLCKDPKALIAASPQAAEKVIEQSKAFSEEELYYISNILARAHDSAKRASSPRIIFEMAVVKVARRQSLAPLADMLEKLKEMERRLEKGVEIASSPKVNKTPRPAERDPADPLTPSGRRDNDGISEAPVVSGPPPIAATEAPPAVDIEFSQIEEVWPTLIKAVKPKKMSAASYLMEASLVSFKEGTLTVGFPKNYSLHREALERAENKLLIEDAAEGLLRRKIRIKFTTLETMKGDAAAYGRDARPAPGGAAESEMLKEPLVQSALEVFDGRVIRKRK